MFRHFHKIPFWIILITLLSACGPMPAAGPAAATLTSETVLDATTPAIPTIEPFFTAVPPDSVITVDTIGAVEPLHTLTAHTDRVTDVAFSPDGAYLASSGWDGKIRLWDTQSWQEVVAFDVRRSDMNVIAFSPFGSLLATSETVWDVARMQVACEFDFTEEVGHVAFSPDGSTLAVAGFPPTVMLWDVTSCERIRSFERQAEATGYYSIEFSPNGELLATGGASNGTVTLWDVATGQVTFIMEHGDQSAVHDLAFSPDGGLLAGGGTGSAVRIWDLSSGEVLHEIPLDSAIYGLAFSPDGKILALATSWSRAAQLWDVERGEMLARLRHADELMDVAFSLDGTLLATGGYDNTVVIWGVSR